MLEFIVRLAISASTIALMVGAATFGLGAVLDFDNVAKGGIIVAILGAASLGIAVSFAFLFGIR